MNDDDAEQKSSGRMILAQAMKMSGGTGGTPYWWRQELEKVAAGLEAGHLPRKLSSRILSETAGRLQIELAEGEAHPNPAVRSTLREHHELGLQETHEFAEAHGLPISKSVSLAVKKGGPPISR